VTNQHLLIKAEPLKLILKAKVRHAAKTRRQGESIWVQAERRGQRGFGEGCPRSYVAGDDLDSSLEWVRANFCSSPVDFSSLDDLRYWVFSHQKKIDQYPSAWCAVEMAVLDLLAREKNCTVETLLGLHENTYRGRYSAVLGDDTGWKYAALVEQYLIRGFHDFKIKISGDLTRDKEKIEMLDILSSEHRHPPPRIRLDANNLWKDRCDDAIHFIQAMNPSRIYAVEEPVGAKSQEEISRFSLETGLPVILDESLCTMNDLRLFEQAPGRLMANIKVSRVGGLLRALEMITEIKKQGWPIIIGCHVGETSLLSRAAMVAAAAAGDHLVAQEGAFGDYLLQREPFDPTLTFGHGGRLDLQKPYRQNTARGVSIVMPENWRLGFGIRKRKEPMSEEVAPEINFLEMSDGYRIHFRRWGVPGGEDVFFILQGGMTHSGWQSPLAFHLRSFMPDLTVVAADQRGCGINADRGDFGSVAAMIDDVVEQIGFLKKSFRRVHLSGWGHGAQQAALAAVKARDALSSLTFIAPAFFLSERVRVAFWAVEKAIMQAITIFQVAPERNLAVLPIPLEPADFTGSDSWQDFIENDPLKTSSITLKSLKIMKEIEEMSWAVELPEDLPVLSILATRDLIVDNQQVAGFLENLRRGKLMHPSNGMECGHAIQFEKPKEGALSILEFLQAL
jgi:L-alanine-DL-glutamate epimerase-like enolase superfamily enzyme/pimeloyl-ACP methyl ester carboxylesterase